MDILPFLFKCKIQGGTRMKKMCVFAWPNYSHTMGIIPLVKELVENRDFEVHMFADAKYKQNIEGAGAIFQEYQLEPKDYEMFDDDAQALQKKYNGVILDTKDKFRQGICDQMQGLMKMYKVYYKAVQAQVERINPDLVMRDCCAIFGKMVANRRHIPCVGYTTSLNIDEVYFRSNPKDKLRKYYNIDFGFLTPEEELTIVDEIIQLCKQIGEEGGVGPLPIAHTINADEQMCIVFSSECLQPIINNKHECLIAKHRVFEQKDKDEDGEKPKQDIIYVSTGSFIEAPVEFYNSIINAFKDTTYRVVISHPRVHEITFKELPSNIEFHKYVDQISLLKQAKLFISHGGYNSLCESIKYQVPLLVYPLSNDQYIDAEQVEKVGIGKSLEGIALTKNNWLNISKFIIENEQIKTNLRNVKKSCEEAMPLDQVASILFQKINNKDK